MERSDSWWMGLDPERTRTLNNCTPCINFNWLTTTLLMEPDEKRRVAAVYKFLRSLDRFHDSYGTGGAGQTQRREPQP